MSDQQKKASGAQAPAPPIATASVTTPATPQKPNGYLWAALDACETPEQVQAVEDEAVKHGYAPDGQLRTAIAARLSGE